ncbi:MAG: sugar ABC transporter substrate-binding protein [Chloroflexota bacterium]|nr:sugar ABC transporter substrate-binding protein [Chloroflexota bacterium]
MNVISRAAVVMTVMALVLVACGRSNEGASSSGAASLAPAVSSGPVSGDLTVWAMGTEGQELGVLAADFMADNPDVKVKVTAVPWDAAHDKIATAIAGDTTPDVSLIGTTWMGEFAKTGALDLTPANIDPKSFFEGGFNTSVVDGKSFGVPWYVETRLIYYRTDLAAKAGFTAAPKNWDELKKMAQGMVAKGGAKYGLALQAGGTGSWQSFLPFAWQAGASVTDDKGTFTLDSDAMNKALAYYVSYFTDKLSPTALEPGALEQGFVDGKIGAFISGPWTIGTLKDPKVGGAKIAGKWGLMHMPTETKGTSFVGGGDLVVFKNSKNRDAAWKFVEYLSMPDVQVKWFKTVNDLPSVKSAWDDAALSGDENVAKFGDQLNDAQSPPTIATWEEVAAAIDSEVEKATKGTEPPADAVKAMQQQATSIGTGS